MEPPCRRFLHAESLPGVTSLSLTPSSPGTAVAQVLARPDTKQHAGRTYRSTHARQTTKTTGLWKHGEERLGARWRRWDRVSLSLTVCCFRSGVGGMGSELLNGGKNREEGAGGGGAGGGARSIEEAPLSQQRQRHQSAVPTRDKSCLRSSRRLPHLQRIPVFFYPNLCGHWVEADRTDLAFSPSFALPPSLSRLSPPPMWSFRTAPIWTAGRKCRGMYRGENRKKRAPHVTFTVEGRYCNFPGFCKSKQLREGLFL